MHLFEAVTTPPHCPNPKCPFHRDATGWRYLKKGFHLRKHPPLKVQRYQCLECGRGFSLQTFRIGYWCRQQDEFGIVLRAAVAGSGLRQIGRTLRQTRVYVTCRIERLARHCLLLHEQIRPRGAIHEPLVMDGFETFEFSQYAPMHLNILMGARSLAMYGFTESELRRKGRMTEFQKQKRERLEAAHGRPDRDAVRRGIAELIRTFVPPGQLVELHSDEHAAYPPALRDVGPSHRLRHEVTSSTLRRTKTNPLFAVNATDSLIRHSCANHRRETIAFSKRRQSVVDRAWIFAVWRNCVKSASEKKLDDPPAVREGWIPYRPSVEQLLARRHFPSLVPLTPEVIRQYERRLVTRYLERQRVHALTYAY